MIAGGGGIVVLEELEHAKARGAKIYAEVVGYGANSDGYDMVAPSGEGGQRCMKMAMAMADEIGGQEGGRVCQHARHLHPCWRHDGVEWHQKGLYGGGLHALCRLDQIVLWPRLGAAGVHEAIYSLLMVRDGFLAESANINELVEEAEGMNILTKRHDGQVTRVMSNSFGFGGTNACLIFDKWAGE